MSIGKTLFSVVLLVVISIYMLLDMQRLGRVVDRRFPPRPGERPLLRTIEHSLAAYVRGQAALSLIIGVSAGVGLWVLGATGLLPPAQQYALLFGAWVAVTEVIPYLGPWLGAAPPFIYALVVNPISALWVALLFLGIQQIEGHVVVPKVMGNALRLHPLLVIFGLAAGAELYGLAGRADGAAAARGRPRDLGVLRRPHRSRAVAGRAGPGRGRCRARSAAYSEAVSASPPPVSAGCAAASRCAISCARPPSRSTTSCCRSSSLRRPPNDRLPALSRHTVESLVREVEELVRVGVPGVMLFGIPESKDDEGSGAWIEDGIVQQALRALRPRFPELLLVTDVCLCEYTSHGHCGVIADGEVDNDASVELLARTAVSHVEAGADAVAPSDMMDGRVAAIREQLPQTPIIAYSAKYASAFYGPFRDVADSAPAFGDRRGYQMDPGNVREALRECAQDVAEGADMLMVKPALPYLDVLRAVRDRFDLPLAAYNVSGEYAMIKAAAAAGDLDERSAALESLTAIKRAGADVIFTYWAKDFASWL